MSNVYECEKCKAIVEVPSMMVLTTKQQLQLQKKLCADCMPAMKKGRF